MAWFAAIPASLMATSKATKRSRRATASLDSEQFAAIAKAVSDPTRYAILQQIAAAQCCSCAELRETSTVTAATLSHHMKELEAAGLIRIARRGKFGYPSLRRDTWKRYIARLSKL